MDSSLPFSPLCGPPSKVPGRTAWRSVGSKAAETRPVPGELLIRPQFREFSISCYYAQMRDLVILFIHLLTTVVRLARPGGVRSVVAESLLIKHQLLILHRSRQRAPNLRLSDRLVAGWCALFIPPSRLTRSALVLKPSTLLPSPNHDQAQV